MEKLFANSTELLLAQQLNAALDDILLVHHPELFENRVKRDEPSFVQTVFQVRISCLI